MQNAPRGEFCNTLDLQYATICHKDLCFVYFEWPFYTDFTVRSKNDYTHMLYYQKFIKASLW